MHNLIHGFILAAQHLVPGGTAPGQAYFINDAEPINMFEFARPVIAACGERLAAAADLRRRGARGDDRVGSGCTSGSGYPQPLLEPLAVERLYLDNYFSVAKATRDLGYRAAVHHRAGDDRVPAVLHGVVRPDESRRQSPLQWP